MVEGKKKERVIPDKLNCFNHPYYIKNEETLEMEPLNTFENILISL